MTAQTLDDICALTAGAIIIIFALLQIGSRLYLPKGHSPSKLLLSVRVLGQTCNFINLLTRVFHGPLLVRGIASVLAVILLVIAIARVCPAQEGLRMTSEIVSTSPPIDATLAETMTDLAGQLAPTTASTYRYDMPHFAAWLAAEGLTVATLNRAAFIRYRKHLQDTYA